MFKVLRFSADAALVTCLLSAIKNKSGIELRTDGITDETLKKAADLYISAGDHFVDFLVEQARKYPQYFRNRKD